MAGMLVHCDGSTHRWVRGLKWQPDLIAFLDDATSEVYAAYLVEEEGTMSVMAGLRQLIEERGLPCSLYTDRGSHFFLTPAWTTRSLMANAGCRSLRPNGAAALPNAG